MLCTCVEAVAARTGQRGSADRALAWRHARAVLPPATPAWCAASRPAGAPDFGTDAGAWPRAPLVAVAPPGCPLRAGTAVPGLFPEIGCRRRGRRPHVSMSPGTPTSSPAGKTVWLAHPSARRTVDAGRVSPPGSWSEDVVDAAGPTRRVRVRNPRGDRPARGLGDLDRAHVHRGQPYSRVIPPKSILRSTTLPRGPPNGCCAIAVTSVRHPACRRARGPERHRHARPILPQCDGLPPGEAGWASPLRPRTRPTDEHQAVTHRGLSTAGCVVVTCPPQSVVVGRWDFSDCPVRCADDVEHGRGGVREQPRGCPTSPAWVRRPQRGSRRWTTARSVDEQVVQAVELPPSPRLPKHHGQRLRTHTWRGADPAQRLGER